MVNCSPNMGSKPLWNCTWKCMMRQVTQSSQMSHREINPSKYYMCTYSWFFRTCNQATQNRLCKIHKNAGWPYTSKVLHINQMQDAVPFWQKNFTFKLFMSWIYSMILSRMKKKKGIVQDLRFILSIEWGYHFL